MLKIVASWVLRYRKYNVLTEHVKLVRAISKYGRALRINGVNKKALYDMFLLEVRERIWQSTHRNSLNRRTIS